MVFEERSPRSPKFRVIHWRRSRTPTCLPGLLASLAFFISISSMSIEICDHLLRTAAKRLRSTLIAPDLRCCITSRARFDAPLDAVALIDLCSGQANGACAMPAAVRTADQLACRLCRCLVDCIRPRPSCRQRATSLPFT
jgi:hypothetical protein